jgi:ribosomal-protein-serine acetyltransferase
MEKKPLPAKLESPRLILRKHTVDQAYLMYEKVDQDRERLRKFLPWVDHMKSVDNEIWYINECLKDWDQGTMFDYGIYTKEEDYIGNIGVHNISWANDCCELGYWIVSSFEGHGFISAAVQLLEKVLFEAGFNRVEIRCDPENRRSASVPLRSGYQFEGILRKSLLHKDAYRDTAVHAKLRTDLAMNGVHNKPKT